MHFFHHLQHQPILLHWKNKSVKFKDTVDFREKFWKTHRENGFKMIINDSVRGQSSLIGTGHVYTLSSTQPMAPAKQTAAHKFIKNETLSFDTLKFLAQIFLFRNLKVFVQSPTSLDKIPSWSLSYSLNIPCNLHSSLRLVRIAKPSKNRWNSRLIF